MALLHELPSSKSNMLNNEQDERELADVSLQLEGKKQAVIAMDADLVRIQNLVRSEQQSIVAIRTTKADLEESLTGMTNKLDFLKGQETDILERIELQKLELEKLTNYISSRSSTQADAEAVYRSKIEAFEKSLNEYEQKVEALRLKEKEYAANHDIIEAKVLKLKAIMDTLN